MFKRSRATVFVTFGALALCAAPAAFAFDGPAADDGGKVSKLFANPVAALQKGLEGVRNGKSKDAVEALKYAAAGGQPLAQWKLGRMYADGDGVPHDDAKAYEYFAQIVESYDEDNPNRRAAPVVANAFVAVGAYSLTGIPAARIKPDPSRAMEMFNYAATHFGDANAQYNLARMYLDGSGGEKDGRQAARWLNLAAEKSHAPSQALLGQLLFNGGPSVQRQRGRGLMWLTLAREAAVAEGKDNWIIELYDKAVAVASDAERQVALVYLEGHLKGRN